MRRRAARRLELFWVIKQEVLLGVRRMRFDSSRARMNLCLRKCMLMFYLHIWGSFTVVTQLSSTVPIADLEATLISSSLVYLASTIRMPDIPSPK